MQVCIPMPGKNSLILCLSFPCPVVSYAFPLLWFPTLWVQLGAGVGCLMFTPACSLLCGQSVGPFLSQLHHVRLIPKGHQHEVF